MVDVIYQVVDLITRLPDEVPHLLAVPIALLRVCEMVCEFLLDLLQTLTKFRERLANVRKMY